MRIIAGEHRGMRLIGPDDQTTTRPITDRVKTSLFDRLDHAGLIEDAVVGDLFCGTGSLGIECLSRGAKYVVFIERDRKAGEKLKRNLERLNMPDRWRIIRADALAGRVAEAPQIGPWGLVFVDPPYAMMQDDRTARRVYRQIGRFGHTADAAARLILRTPRSVSAEPVAGWRDPQPHHYGGMIVWFYDRDAGEAEKPSANA